MPAGVVHVAHVASQGRWLAGLAADLAADLGGKGRHMMAEKCQTVD